MEVIRTNFCIFLIFCLIVVVYGSTDPNDLKILNDFKKGLENPELLKWPDNGDDPCGPPSWPYVFCAGNRVTQIQAKSLGLKGSLPPSFNLLSELYNLGLQHNKLSGMLPTFSGLSKLEFAFLNDNQFDGIPSDFFDGLISIRDLSLGENPLNASTGWSLPASLETSVQLTNLSLVHCNLIGPVPDFLGTLPSLTNLLLSYNRLSGGIPSSFGQSSMQVLWLNNQDGSGMTGSIDVIASMTSLTQLWLHGNQFTGTIPQNIGNLTSLMDLNLNSNQLVGLIPESLADMELKNLVLNNNRLMGPIPKFKASNISYDFNFFCQQKPGLECAPDVTALLDFLSNLNYPSMLTSQWSGNEPCTGPWLGLSCNPKSEVSIINFPHHRLNGTLSPSLAKVASLLEIRLGGNNLTGQIPSSLTELKSLKLLDLSDNNLEPPLPNFHGVKLVLDGNPLLVNQTGRSPQPISSPPPSSSQSSPRNPSPPSSERPPSSSHSSSSNPSRSEQVQSQEDKSRRFRTLAIVAGAAIFAVAAILVIFLFIYCSKKKKKKNTLLDDSSSIVVHPRDPSNPDVVKIAVANNTAENLSLKTGASSLRNISGESESSHVIDAGNLVISVQVLRKVTKNFSPENELGHGGFGTVYKGELEDGTKIAVKRMESGAMSSKALNEFQAEIAVLSKVRHRHLVSLLGYSIQGNERLLVYEYMPLGALSKHLFHWKSLKLEPLTWSQRLVVALDVARGMEYLHSLARQTFIHRDLKPSNILLDEGFRAKVSDFGLVKLAPDGEKSVVTTLAGTFGYLAPEYAVMGKITTKVDVFSYGVVLMELLTGLMALDESRPEESRYLAQWFWQIKSSKEKLMAAIDPALQATEETFESISIIAELAGHCTAREPNHRPDMSHAVNVLAALVEKWVPIDDESDCFTGIDFGRPLSQMLKDWKEAGSKDVSYASLEDSKGSIPAKPVGFADSFSSADAR
ncbi:receptor protein kinase TMK1-like [Prosopis cineraria]|uniref:receptor protein kinase TMK1-like n=1 Tax=Prosopis cineraria TaxID=364024 RepID=UPI00240F3529|nr:receptor protein kinase TMK1-like [Prosopis cineraria]XP_054813093.1 receptor protein kinase TMK1-like [Prosopis cineraria]XP_054813094.1 receptor protein kinase TMK1-like [Prosopis cineraria]